MPTTAKTIPSLSPKDQSRFESAFEKGPEDQCWEWKLGKTSRGYGVFWMQGKQVRASRVAITIAFGPIPDGQFACHTCDNPSCVNPRHLFLGTTDENMNDMVQKGRAMAGDRHYSRTNPERLARGDRHGSKTKPGRIPSGSDHSRPRAKVTADQVLEIRALKGLMTHAAIARMFGLKGASVSLIMTRKNWKHI